MKMITLCVGLLINNLIFGQDFKIPDTFKHLKLIHLESFGDVYALLPIDYQSNYKNEKEFYDENPVETIIGVVNVDKSSNPIYLITFTNAPSDDHNFSFYRINNDKFEYKFSINGKQIYIPANGFVYSSGHTNNMFDQKRKFKFSGDTIYEISQPFYYVGLKTKTLKPIKLYLDKNEKDLIALVPENSDIEVVASEYKDEINYFLIKTSFGLMGWWKLDDYYSSTIDKLFYAGD